MSVVGTIKRVAVITGISTLLGLSMLPLASTDWAVQKKAEMAERRAARRAQREREAAQGIVQERREPTSGERYVMPVVKVVIAMAVPGTVTLVLLVIGRRVRRRDRVPTNA